MTKIDIVSGFLGAGKTTLIKKLLKEALQGEQVVLIENEFGEIGIDGGFLKEAGVEITEMNSGCICCSLVGDFASALKQVLDQYHPDRILIEPSGVGKLSDVIKAVQSLGEGDSRFSDWFEALRWMENEIDKRDYDVCLIGCGAYGLPLAAHVKRRGKQAIHLGGALQLLFGIKGKRWEDPMYGVKEWRIPQGSYSSLINEYWVRPDSTDTPKSSIAVEGGCYW